MFRSSDSKGDEIQTEMKFSNEFSLPDINKGNIDDTNPTGGKLLLSG